MPQAQTRTTDWRINEREDIQFLLGNPPSWTMRYGIMVVAIVFSVLLLLSYVIKYPDVVTARVVLTTENPPIRMLAPTHGRVQALLVRENDTVSVGTLLAVLDNTADWKAVLQLEKLLIEKDALTIQPPQQLNLGNLQKFYSIFCQNAKDYQYFLNQNGTPAKIAHLQQQIDGLNALQEQLLNQQTIQSQEFQLATTDLARQKKLHQEGVISNMEWEKFNIQYLQQKRQLASIESQFINNEMQSRQLQGQITDLTQSKNDGQNAKQLTLQEDVRRLKAAIEDWKKNYLVIAPIAGQITWSKIWKAHQTVAMNDELLAIVPDATTQNIVGKATAPVAQSGKIQVGTPAFIRLDQFPATTFGQLEGKIKNIALLPQKEDYLVEIVLSNALKTTYHQIVPFKAEMSGTAQLITEDRRILSRLFERIHDLLKNRA
jgi:multidrug resistance efflux pump